VMRRATVVVFAIFAIALILWAGWDNLRARKLGTSSSPHLSLIPSEPVRTVGPPQPPDETRDIRGQVAPPFQLATLDGKKVSLADYKGKAVLVNFWATWCAPCKLEMPWLVELRAKYAPQGFEILGISKDDPGSKDIEPYAKKIGVNYPVLQADEKISDTYRIDFLPMSYFVGRDGKVVEQIAGLPDSKDEVEAAIRQALGTRQAQ
jgi:thiol-disulfide isomerase/thioredoxin